MTVKEKFKRAVSKNFNQHDNYPNAVFLAPLLLTAGVLWNGYKMMSPDISAERDPERGTAAVQTLDAEFQQMADSQNEYKRHLKDSVLARTSAAPQVIQAYKLSHQKFLTDLFMNSDISAKDFDDFSERYDQQFGGQYLNTRLGSLSPRFFKSCQTKVLENGKIISTPDEFSNAMTYCMKDRSVNRMVLFVLGGVFGSPFVFLASMGGIFYPLTKQLQKTGQKWKDEFDKQARTQAAAATVPAIDPTALKQDIEIGPPLQLKNPPEQKPKI